MGIPNKTLSCRLSPEDWARIHVIRQLYGPHNNTDAVKLALQKAVPELFRSDNLESFAANTQALDRMILHDGVIQKSQLSTPTERGARRASRVDGALPTGPQKTQPKVKAKGAA